MTKNDLANKSVSLMKERDALEKQVRKLTLENKKLNKQLLIDGVSKWVAISNYVSPERLSDVIAKLNDGTEIQLEFEVDGRFYDESGEDFTEQIKEWKQL
jgi:hypothetical protein